MRFLSPLSALLLVPLLACGGGGSSSDSGVAAAETGVADTGSADAVVTADAALPDAAPSADAAPADAARPDAAPGDAAPGDAAPGDAAPSMDAAPGDTGAPDAAMPGTVGPAGGTVTGGGATLVIPAGALAAPVMIGASSSMTPPTALPAAWELASPVYAFTPHGQAFAAAVSVRLPYTGMATAVLRLDGPADTTWEEVAGATFQAMEARFTTTTFSFYAVVRPAAQSAFPALYSNAAQWNDYVLNDGADLFSAGNAACAGTAASNSNRWLRCIHGGEMRAFAVPGRASCAGLTAQDTLGAFEWTCRERAGVATMISYKLKDAVRLAALIDTAVPAWRPNSLVISEGQTTVLTTPAAVWWSNPVVADNDGGTLSTAGAVVVVNANVSQPYSIRANGVSLVVAPGRVIGPVSGVIGTPAVEVGMSGSPVQRVWIEGDFRGDDMHTGVNLANPAMSVIRHVTVRDIPSYQGGYGIGGTGRSLRFERVRASCLPRPAGMRGFGVAIEHAGDGSLVRDIRVAGCGSGIRAGAATTIEGIHASSIHDRIGRAATFGEFTLGGDIMAMHNDSDFTIEVTRYSVVQHVTSVNNKGYGFSVNGPGTIVSGVVATQNYIAGVLVTRLNEAVPVQFWDTASFANTHNGFVLDGFDPRPGGGLGHRFHGRFAVGGNGYSPPIHYQGQMCFPDLGCGGCAPAGDCTGSRTSSITGPGMGDGLVSSNRRPNPCVLDVNSDAAYTYVGPNGGRGYFPTRYYQRDEPVNRSDNLGTQAPSMVADWFDFENPYRGWGAEGVATPNCFAQGACETGSMGTLGCQIYDYSLRANVDPVLWGAALPHPNGDDVIRYSRPLDFFVRDAADCTRYLSGTVVMIDGEMRCQTTFLRLAREILRDGVGNDDSLCQSNEVCLFTPNIGAYQGHGPLRPVASAFMNGAVSNVRLVEHTTNGVADPYAP